MGRSGVGKTTALERLLPWLGDLRVAILKHSHHPLELDRPGTDSDRLAASGMPVLLVSRGQHLLRGPLTVEQGVGMLEALGVDLVLVEGGKNSSLPKIEVVRGEPPVLGEEDVIATIGWKWPSRPSLSWDEPARWAQFLRGQLGD